MSSTVDSEGVIGAAADFHEILAAISKAPDLAPVLAAMALDEVRHGVMTGEGPTTRGRVHFSRTIDAQDTALCARILVEAGEACGRPVSRNEADVLFRINDAAQEREDGGRFDDLFVKAIAHHVLAAAGREVPPREVALAPATPIADWAAPADFEAVDREIANWLASHVRGSKRRGGPLNTIAALLIGAGAVHMASSLAALLDFTA
jgi:hypothetical protein